jgi:acylphosphatase
MRAVVEETTKSVDRQRMTVRIYGEVQGVGFRYFVKKAAAGVLITGFVRNDADGTLSIVAEGSVGELEKLLEAVKEGPVAAEVEEVEVSWTSAFGKFEGFKVRLW